MTLKSESSALRITGYLLQFALLAWSAGGMAGEPPDSGFVIGEKQRWGEDTQVTPAGRLYIAGQPDRTALEQARKAGVELVINLRGASESDWDEAAEASDLGLEYHQIPVNGAAEKLAPEPFRRISEVVLANPDAEILVHCSSGNRASAWFATHLALAVGMDIDEAISAAQRTGLSNKGLEQKVREFLSRSE